MILTPETCLHRLRRLYRDAHDCPPSSDANVISWASNPHPWAEDQIRHRGWSYTATDAVVRNCKSLVIRARLVVETNENRSDPFDPLMPTAEPSAD